jgi:hypothetical protein
VSRGRGLDARRILPPTNAEAQEHVSKALGVAEARWIEMAEFPFYYLNRQLIEARKLSVAKVEEALADWLRGQDDVLQVYTRTQLLGEIPETDRLGRQVQKSFHPERSPNVQAVTKPYHIMSNSYRSSGTTHGTPHRYDTHVPLVVYGAGVRAGSRPDPVTPQAAAAILAHGLGVKPPAKAEALLPPGLFAE